MFNGYHDKTRHGFYKLVFQLGFQKGQETSHEKGHYSALMNKKTKQNVLVLNSTVHSIYFLSPKYTGDMKNQWNWNE